MSSIESLSLDNGCTTHIVSLKGLETWENQIKGKGNSI